MPRSDTFSRTSVSTTKNSTPIPVPIANQTRGHDQGAAEHFVRRFALAATLPYRGLHAARNDEAGESHDGQSRPPYSHSIINEPSKLLIRKALAAASKIFTVIFTVNLCSTRIGAGFRPVRPNLTFRDLSTSIDSDDGCQFHRRACMPVGKAAQKGTASNTLSRCPATLFRPHFYRHGAARAVRLRVSIEIRRLA
jgi:hypothetical protein